MAKELGKFLSSKTRCKRGPTVLVLLVGMGFQLMTGCSKTDSTEGKSETQKYLSLNGVVFRIPDEEALVLPSNVVSGAKWDDGATQVQNFTLCVELPSMELRGDRAARRGCLRIGDGQSDWMMINVGVVSSASQAVDFQRGLARLLNHQITRSASPRYPNAETYVRGVDMHGLHAFHPTGPNLRPSSKSLFWRGTGHEQGDTVETLIECAGQIPGAENRFRKCDHNYELSLDDVPSWRARVTLHYNDKWLTEWHSVETGSRALIQALRAEEQSTKE